jgi:hypothetical protein
MKAFIIYLPEREHSVRHSQMMLDQLKEYNIDAELFEGTPGDKAVAMARKSEKTLYPYSIKNRRLNDQDIKELIRPELYENFIKKHQFEIIDDWMFDDIKQNQYLRHIGRGNPLRKTFFNQIMSTYNQGKIESSLEAIKELVVAYDTTTIKYD